MSDISGSLLPAGVDLTMKYLIGRLKWLETMECRLIMGEERRIEERRKVTEKFKSMLSAKEVFNNMILNVVPDDN